MIDDHDDEAALETVLAYLDAPPLEGSEEDRLFGQLLRKVNEAAAATREESADAPLVIGEELQRRLLDLEQRRRSESQPFGEHPDGLGPTLGMDVSHS